MKNRQTYTAILIVAMSLGTAWAVRGKFGHEQGAAWAGAIGALSLILVARRQEWYDKAFKIALASAFGWGIGGMISYGVVVGYGRGSDFGNVYYGFLMLFVIGALYGFLGGGFFGLAISDVKNARIKWHSLITEMLAFGLLTYAFLVNQLEWLMTPPRSELWAACLGASIAMAWFMVRNGNLAALRVGIYAALGGGFGFAFGNFLQVIGTGSALPFNFWNVMEYSIGFFGGLGMAYGTLTSQWPAGDVEPTRRSNLLPVVMITVFIPLLVLSQSFVTEKLSFLLKIGGSENTVFAFQVLALVSAMILILIVLLKFYRNRYTQSEIKWFFVLYLGLYTFLSFLLTGIYVHPVEQYLYLVNITAILLLLPSLKNTFEFQSDRPGVWTTILAVLVGLMALLAVIAISSHGVLRGSQIRFS